MLNSVCVFCGSNAGRYPEYREAARQLGGLLARRGQTLVYGGASVGLMGALADAAIEAGGRVIGIIPEGLLRREVAHGGKIDLRVVGSMHERKAAMAELSDAFIALPGGCGTFEEFFEIVTWAQLGIHSKPCGLLNIRGYYDPLLTMFDHAIKEGFVKEAQRGLVLNASTPEALLLALEEYVPSPETKWIRTDQT